MAMTYVYNVPVAITKSDTVNIALPEGRRYTDAVYVGGAGVIAAVFPDGTVQNLTAVAGAILPIAIIRVNDTNTTATLLVALFQV